MPEDYYRVVRWANGFVLKDSFFRFFGTEPCGSLPSVLQWNASPWVTEYGDLVGGVVFIAEDVFGDQYGFSFRGQERPRLVKFWCEGGEIQQLDVGSLDEWLSEAVLVQMPSFFDSKLMRLALRAGLRTTVEEHLSFSVPLITGGGYECDNLEVLNAQFHLHLLGQLSSKNRLLPEGTRIARFWGES